MKLIVFSLCLLGLVNSSFQCSPPGPNWKPLSIEERARKAPLVIKAYLVQSFANILSTTTLRSRRCFYVTQIYKGSLYPRDHNYICAEKFGDGAQCLSDVSYGQPYIIFLNKMKNSYVARYDDIHSAVVRFDHNSVQEELRKGLCCPSNKDCDKQLPCSRNECGVVQCNCGLHPKGSTVKGSKGVSPPGPPTRGPATNPGPPGPPGSK